MISVLGIDVGAYSIRASFLGCEIGASIPGRCIPVVDHLGRNNFPAFFCPDNQNPHGLVVGFAAIKEARSGLLPQRLTPEMLASAPNTADSVSFYSGFEIISHFLQQIVGYADTQFALKGLKPITILSLSTPNKKIENELGYALKSVELQFFHEALCIPASLAAMYAVPQLEAEENSMVLLVDMGCHFRHTLIRKEGEKFTLIVEHRDPASNLLDTSLKNYLFSDTPLKQVKEQFSDQNSPASFQLQRLLQDIKSELAEVDEVAMKRRIQLGSQEDSYVDVTVQIDRPTLLELITPSLKRSIKQCKEMLSQKQVDNLDHVIITGGQAALPLVRHLWESEFPRCIYIEDRHLFASGACRRVYNFAATKLSRYGMDESSEKPEQKTFSGTISMQKGEEKKLLIPEGIALPYSYEEKFEFRKGKRCQNGGYSLTLSLFQGEGALPPWHIEEIPPFIKESAPVFLKVKSESERDLQAELYFPSLRLRYEKKYELPAPFPPQASDLSDRLGFSIPSIRRSTRGGGPSQGPVQCSLYAPRRVKTNSYFQVNLFIHRNEQESDVRARMAEFIQIEEAQRKQGQIDLGLGSELNVVLDMPGMEIQEPTCKLIWRGDIASADFIVAVPASYNKENAVGKLILFKKEIPILSMVFILEVGNVQGAPESLDPIINKVKQAFVSYASRDRQQVLLVLQGLRAGLPHVKFFMDIMSLVPGEHFAQKLMQAIDLSDMFYLFWSKAASESVWVEKEWRYALERKGIDYIAPIPLVAPHAVPPPPELGAQLHFYDQILAFRENAVSNPGTALS